MRKDILKLIVRLVLVLLPAIVIAGFSLAVFCASGELTSLDKVIDIQQGSQLKTLYGAAYSDPDIYYKMQSTLKRKPKILVLGTSRVLPFRAYFFKETLFYNAGRGIRKIEDLKAFIQQIPVGQEPQLLIIGLDQNFFNQAWSDGVEGAIDSRFYQKTDRYKIYANHWAGLYKDYLKKKFHLKQVFFPEKSSVKIGLNAIAKNNGFRTDGSYSYGEPVDNLRDPQNKDYGFQFTLAGLVAGEGRLQFGDAVSEQALRQLDDFLSVCDKKNIRVIGFLPVYAHSVYKALQNSAKHTYMLKIEERVRPLFQSQHAEFFNFSDLAALGASDQETTDGLHGSEKAYLRIFLNMLRESAILKEYATDAALLEARLKLSEKELIHL